MTDRKKIDEVLESEYDGIKEYDNDLPGWWRMLFYITIFSGVIYAGYMHLGSDKSTQVQFAENLKREQAQKEAVAAAAPTPNAADDQQVLLALVTDQPTITKGYEIYTAKCAACHGPTGGGVIGPNLTDEFWIHGGTITEIKTVIENGVLDKGMLSWKAMLPADDIKAVTAYVYSLAGSNPANPKAPQGTKVVR